MRTTQEPEHLQRWNCMDRKHSTEKRVSRAYLPGEVRMLHLVHTLKGSPARIVVMNDASLPHPYHISHHTLNNHGKDNSITGDKQPSKLPLISRREVSGSTSVQTILRYFSEPLMLHPSSAFSQTASSATPGLSAQRARITSLLFPSSPCSALSLRRSLPGPHRCQHLPSHFITLRVQVQSDMEAIILMISDDIII